jgi:hypothetical protein
MDLKTYFTDVYNNNSWKSHESHSGPGSERNHPTIKNLIYLTIKLINDNFYNNKSIIIIDCPCGDFNWIDMLLSNILKNTNIKNIKYYGYDIVDLNNDFNTKLKKIENVEYNFIINDVTQNIPIYGDIIICKELFIHLSYDDIKKVLNNFIYSKSLYLIVNDFESDNKDLSYNKNELGSCREISLTRYPFNLINYEYKYEDYKIWKISELNIF